MTADLKDITLEEVILFKTETKNLPHLPLPAKIRTAEA
jgi:hypothetical protein